MQKTDGSPIENKNRRLYRILGLWGAVFLFIILAWLIIVWLVRPGYIPPVTSGWRTGDIFFSVGDSWESVAVRSLTGLSDFAISDSTPSHCGIVVRDHCNLMLVHASTVEKKIVIESPEEYLKKNGSFCIYAATPHCHADSSALTQILDSLHKAGVPFDFKFDHSDDKSLYCTEMVIKVYELAGTNGLSELREKKYIYPKDLLNKCTKYRK